MIEKLTEQQVIKLLEPLCINLEEKLSFETLSMINTSFIHKGIFKFFLKNIYLSKKNLSDLKNLEIFLKELKPAEIMDIFLEAKSINLITLMLEKLNKKDIKKIFTVVSIKRILKSYKSDNISSDKIILLKKYVDNFLQHIIKNEEILDPKFLFFFIRDEEEKKIYSKKLLKNWNDNWDVQNIFYNLEYKSLNKEEVLFCIDTIYKDKGYDIDSLYRKIDPKLQEDEEICKKCEEKYFYLDVKKSAIKGFEDFAENVSKETILPYGQWDQLLIKAKSINLFDESYNIIRFLELLIEKNMISDFDFQAGPSFHAHPFLDFLKENSELEFLTEFKNTEKGKELWNYSITRYKDYNNLEIRIFPEIISYLKSTYYKLEINKDLNKNINVKSKERKSKI